MKIIKISFAVIALFIAGCEPEEAPGITTFEITEITTSSAVTGGNIHNPGSSDVIEYGVCWNTDPDPTIANNKIAFPGSWGGSFSAKLEGLKGGATYYVRAYATNKDGTGYGEAVSFQTAGAPPTITTLSVENNLPPKATLVGEVAPNLLPTTVTFEYGLTTSYGQSATITDLIRNETVRKVIDGLVPNTTYHYRVIAENEAGKSIGEDMTFISRYEIGQKIGLSYIIHIDETGLHGLICAQEPAPDYSNYIGGWSDPPTALVTGASDTELGTGASNTAKIIAAHGPKAHHAYFVYTLRYNNQSDWVMPSKDELNLIYKNIKQKGLGFYASASSYWSSSEYSKDSVWCQNFGTGAQFLKHKFEVGAGACAVRKF